MRLILNASNNLIPGFVGLALLLATEVSALTIDEIPALVRQENRDVRAARQDIEAADQGVSAAWGGFFPKLELKSTYTRLNDDLTIDIKPKHFERDILNGTVTIGLDIDPPPIKVQDKNIRNAHLLATQPLYTGGRLSAGKDAATAQRDEVILQLDKTTQEKTLESLTRYFQVQLARSSLQILQQARKDLERIAQISRALVNTGMAAKFSTLQIDVALAEVTGRISEAEAKEKLASLAFKSSVGLDMSALPSFDSPLLRVPLNLGLDVYKTQALQKRQEFGILQAKSKQVEALQAAKTGEMLPTVYAFGKRELLPDQLTALQPLWAVGVGIDIPLTAGLTSYHERAKAAALVQKITLLQEKAQLEIPLQVESLYAACIAAKATLVALDSGASMAQEALRLAEVRLKNGSGSSVEILKASTDLETMELKRLLTTEEYNRHLMELYQTANALDDYLKAYANVKKI